MTTEELIRVLVQDLRNCWHDALSLSGEIDDAHRVRDRIALAVGGFQTRPLDASSRGD